MLTLAIEGKITKFDTFKQISAVNRFPQTIKPKSKSLELRVEQKVGLKAIRFSDVDITIGIKFVRCSKPSQQSKKHAISLVKVTWTLPLEQEGFARYEVDTWNENKNTWRGKSIATNWMQTIQEKNFRIESNIKTKWELSEWVSSSKKRNSIFEESQSTQRNVVQQIAFYTSESYLGFTVSKLKFINCSKIKSPQKSIITSILIFNLLKIHTSQASAWRLEEHITRDHKKGQGFVINQCIFSK